MNDAAELLAGSARRVNLTLAEALGSLADAPPRLVEAMRYSIDAGGKRLRPALVLAACRAAGGDDTAALPAAAAIELIHTFSLVHDDLPAMDDDDLRRGKPTSHIVFGEAMAILAGDAMVTLAFELLPTVGQVRELATAAGPVGMIGGQVMDLAGEGRELSLDDLKAIHARKTGALIAASFTLGGLAAATTDTAPLTQAGTHAGLAFQIVDDLLDETADAATLGKTPGKDAAAGKATYPALLGRAAARAAAEAERDAALAALAPLGDAADDLRTLIRFVTDRGH